jgi:hypothetical protein
MKINEEMNEKLKDAIASVRQCGEPIEIYWDRESNSPFDEKLHGQWGGDLADTKYLRKWLAQHPPDGREITIYCRGDAQYIKFE